MSYLANKQAARVSSTADGRGSPSPLLCPILSVFSFQKHFNRLCRGLTNRDSCCMLIGTHKHLFFPNMLSSPVWYTRLWQSKIIKLLFNCHLRIFFSDMHYLLKEMKKRFQWSDRWSKILFKHWMWIYEYVW